MKKISVLLATFIIVATSLTACKKTVNSNESNKKDTVTVVTNSTVVIDSSNVDSILQKKDKVGNHFIME